MKVVKIFEEFIKVSDYKEWSKFTNKYFYDKLGEYFLTIDDHDKKFNRIYFDLKVNRDNFQIVVPDEITDFFKWYGYPIIDYEKGLCRDKDGRQIRIGKLLTKLGEDKLLKTYNQSKSDTLKNTDDLQIVISRHPYDIIGMSTNRGWTTCHDLNDKRYGGRHLHNISSDLKKGTLVAYLIRKSDRNISNPISRCLLFNSEFYNNPKLPKLRLDNHIYGTYVKEFVKKLSKFCEEYNNYGDK